VSAAPHVLEPPDVDAALAERRLRWRREGAVLVRDVQRRNFAEALDFVNRVGELATRADHHPDVDIRWGTVVLRLSTHSAGGITAKDLALAEQIDSLDAAGA
jgi:4a-hydroxytetrahydrobiopterin dehydratase